MTRSDLVFGILAALYLLLRARALRNGRPAGAYPGSWLIKALPVLWLAMLAWRADGGPALQLLAVGLLCSAVGDIVLEWDRRRLFAAGLGAFLLAHIWYIAALTADAAFQVPPRAVAGLIGVAAFGLGSALWPRLGSLRIPVLLYIAVITGMALTAVSRLPFNLSLTLGALLFMLSDALIAVDKFLRPVPGRDWAIMTTYYAAQWLLWRGLWATIQL